MELEWFEPDGFDSCKGLNFRKLTILLRHWRRGIEPFTRAFILLRTGHFSSLEFRQWRIRADSLRVLTPNCFGA